MGIILNYPVLLKSWKSLLFVAALTTRKKWSGHSLTAGSLDGIEGLKVILFSTSVMLASNDDLRKSMTFFIPGSEADYEDIHILAIHPYGLAQSF
ncbi:MAG: hypothetical protein WC055_17065 [Melioribacteraceae bacterium]